MKYLLLLFISLLIFSSCSSKSDSANRDTNIQLTEKSTDSKDKIHPEDFEGLFTTPRDSMSVEQKEIQHKLLTLMKENVKVKDDHIYITATKEDFENQGIAASYYYLLQEIVNDLNAVIKEDGIDAKMLYEEMMKDLSDI